MPPHNRGNLLDSILIALSALYFEGLRTKWSTQDLVLSPLSYVFKFLVITVGKIMQNILTRLS